MDSTIRRLLGEAEDAPEKPEEKLQPEENNLGDQGRAGPEDAEIDELANLWTTGNKGEVIRRFMEMNNEMSVKLVFAIGREGAVEMARMVDQAAEQDETPSETGAEIEEPAATTEPSRIEQHEPAQDDGYPARQIMGQYA